MNEITKTKSQLPATPADDDPYCAYGRAVGSDMPFLKFVKGDFRYGTDDEVLPLGTRLVPNMTELKAGFLKWKDREPVDEVMVQVGTGEPIPQREELDDQDKSTWQTDPNGTPIDPWGIVNTLPFKDPETGREFVFTTSSKGGIGAVGKLSTAFGSQREHHNGKLPIVEIGGGSYWNKSYNCDVPYPTFKIVGWQGETELIAGNETLPNDDIPF